MPYLSQVSITLSSRMEPPGWAIYRTPLRCARSMLSPKEMCIRDSAEGCVQAGCALIGGETAEMPGFYPVDEYDLAGFCVGMADYHKIVDSSRVQAGDALIGVKSSGVHSNGFSLVLSLIHIYHVRHLCPEYSILCFK